MMILGMVRRAATRAALAAGIICSLANAAAAGDTSLRASLNEAVRAFDEAALYVNDAQPADLVRWTGPIFLAISDIEGLQQLAPEIEASVRTLAEIAGIAVVRVGIDDPRRNFLVRAADPAGRAACRASVYSQAGHITRVEVELWRASRAIRRCANHEVMHAFGFRSHAHGAPSILSYQQRHQSGFSELDRLLVATLYDPRLQTGMKPAAGSAAACGIIAQKLGLTPQAAGPLCTGGTLAGHASAFGSRAVAGR
jgi:hypothetical protein